jgi:uncharacterized protein YkwD
MLSTEPRFSPIGAARGLVLGLVLLATPAAATDRSTIEGYAEAAQAAIAHPPGDVRFLKDLEQRLMELAAERRQAAGVPPLQPDPGLRTAARAHVLDMLERGYFDHVSPDGQDASDRVAILDRRFIGTTGENLAQEKGIPVADLGAQTGPLAQRIVDGWMHSPEHRRNLLDRRYTDFGLAAAGQGKRIVIVQDFGHRYARLAEPVPLQVEQETDLPLKLARGGNGPLPERFAFAPPGSRVKDLVPLPLSASQVVVGPGEYRLKFYVPTSRPDQFEVVDGPALVIIPARASRTSAAARP